MDSIKTFVIFKTIETECESFELVMLAVHANEITRTYDDKFLERPRIMDKIVLKFFPRESRDRKVTFDPNTEILVSMFLNRQEKPIKMLDAGKPFSQLQSSRKTICAEKLFEIIGASVENLFLVENLESQETGEERKSAYEVCDSLLDTLLKVASSSNAFIENSPLITANILQRFSINETLETISNNPETPFKTETYVYLNFKTTGLFKEDRITEICLLAGKVEDLLSLKNMEPSLVIDDVWKTTRDTLLLVTDPQKMIPFNVVHLNGLDNASIQSSKKPPFDEDTVKIIEAFLMKQEQPVCFLAFNGSSFHYPRLRDHLKLLHYQSRILNHMLVSDPMWVMNSLSDLRGDLEFRYNFYTGENGIINRQTAEGDARALMILTMVAPNVVGNLDTKRKKLYQTKSKKEKLQSEEM